MNEYIKLAREYFGEFEGRELYPAVWSWTFWLGVVLLAVWVASVAYWISAGSHAKTWGPEMTLVGAAEVAFLLFSSRVQARKRRNSIERAKRRYGIENDDLDLLKGAALQRLTGVEPHGFLAVAEECSKLQKLKGEFRLAADGSGVSLGRRIYDPDSKARLLAIILSSFAIFVALLPKTDPEQGYALIAAMSDPSVRAFVWTIMVLAGMVFLVWIAIQQILQSTGGFVRTWVARMTPSSSAKDIAMRYFVRDLIAFHQPASAVRVQPQANESDVASVAGSPQQRRERVSVVVSRGR
jgi:hypothetical protein